MNKISYTLKFCIIGLVLAGCASVEEVSKTMWGSSTRALEAARTEAASKIFEGNYEECFREVLKTADLEKWTVFVREKTKQHIVLMGIKGQVSTTEVGVFFSELNDGGVKVDVTSLSSNAKMKVANILFKQLADVFKERAAS